MNNEYNIEQTIEQIIKPESKFYPTPPKKKKKITLPLTLAYI